MKYQNLGYVLDKEGFFYQIYGLIQPKGKLLCQISYVPEDRAPFINTKKKKLNGKDYIKWTPLVDIKGVMNYKKLNDIILPKYINYSKLASQIVEVPIDMIEKYFPPIPLNSFNFCQKNKEVFNKILAEFNLEFEDVFLGGLTNISGDSDIFENILPEKFNNPKNDLDFYIYDSEKSKRIKDILKEIRLSEKERLNVWRGNLGEKIAHRVSCEYIDNREISIDFLLSPNASEVNIDFQELSNSYEDWSIEKEIDCEFKIKDITQGFSFPQIYSNENQKLLISAHRYDWLFQGNVKIKGKILKTLNSKYILVEEYGNINGEQLLELK